MLASLNSCLANCAYGTCLTLYLLVCKYLCFLHMAFWYHLACTVAAEHTLVVWASEPTAPIVACDLQQRIGGALQNYIWLVLSFMLTMTSSLGGSALT